MSNKIIIDEFGLYETREGQTIEIFGQYGEHDYYDWSGKRQDDKGTLGTSDFGWMANGSFNGPGYGEGVYDIIRKKSLRPITDPVERPRYMAEI